MRRIRAYHAALAILTVLAYLTGDFGAVHDWLGYAVGVVVVLRLLWALVDRRHVGLSRFYPDFDGLKFDNALRHPAVSRVLILGLGVSVIAATVTGLPLAGGDGHEGLMEELHESLSGFVLFFALLHAGYLLVFRFPLARFMLFRDKKDR